MKLKNEQTALILAGLRLLQQEVERGDLNRLPVGVVRILDDANIVGISTDSIDRLCEKVNAPDPTVPAMPFKTPIRIEDERFLVAADSELIIEATAYEKGELEAIVAAVNAQALK